LGETKKNTISFGDMVIPDLPINFFVSPSLAGTPPQKQVNNNNIMA
jgi:hypothetical protein